jgi:excisionase family DNA binding protein
MSKKQSATTPETITISETAQTLGVDNKTVRQLVEQGDLGYVHQRINKESVTLIIS